MTSMAKTRGKLLDVLLLVFAVSFAVGVAVNKVFIYAWRPPVEMRSVEALNSPVPLGGELRVAIDRLKTRECPVTSTRFAMDQDGRKHYLGAVTWEGGPEGDGVFEVRYHLNSLEPGDYTLNVALTYHCPERAYIIQQPDVRFRVIEGDV